MSATANPSPAWESTATQIKISELKQDHMRHTLEKLRSESSGLVLFTAQWRNLEEHFEAVRAELRREMEDYELRRKQMEWKQKYLKQKAKEIETREARLGEESRRVEERGREIDATYELVRRCYEIVREKERELEERETRVERKAARVKMRERKVDEVEIRAARAEEKVELREKDLEVREMEVRERIDEVEFKEKELGVREMEVGKRIEEVELREKDLGVREMEVRKRIEEIELKEEFVAGLGKGGGGIVVDEKYEVFRMRAVRHVEELELRERNVEVVERELAKRFDEVVLKEKRLAETMEEFKRGEQELEERIREVDSRKRLKSVICCAENESPIDDGESEGSGDASYANIRFNVTMDGRALQMFLNGRVNDHETLRGEVVGGLQMSHDPAKLVLDAMHGFYADDFEGDDAGFDLNVVRRSCILLLEQLMLLNRRIKNPVRERAMELAVKWKWKMTAVREHYLEVVGFLQLVASYGLATGLDKDELVEFVVTAAQHPHAPTLCRSLGLADKVPDPMAAAGKNVVIDLMKEGKLDDRNYDLWHRKIQLLLEDLEVLEPITLTMDPPESGNNAQHRREQEAYQEWRKKDRKARLTLLATMRDDIMLRFERHNTTKAVWDAVKLQYGETSTTRLRHLTLKFEGYKKRSDHFMRQHLTTMINMIGELGVAGHALTDEQQVQAVIISLPRSWEHMRVYLTHDDLIRTFDDVSRHLEMEEDRLIDDKTTPEAHMASTSQRRASGSQFKRRREDDSMNRRPAKRIAGTAPRKASGEKKKKFQRGTRGGKKVKAQKDRACFTCGKNDHFSRDCTEQKEPRII